MYDTVTIELKHEQCKDISFIDHVGPKLDKLDRMTYNDYVTYKGFLDKKLEIRISDRWVKIPKGNLKHYFFSNPFYDFKRGSFEEAIKKLSDELELPIEKAKVNRIDIGPTVSMKYDASLYFNHLGLAPGYKRLDQDNGVTYKSKSDTFVIYHKQPQLSDKGIAIPKDKKGRNHIRLEHRVSKNIGPFYGKEIVRVKDLYDEVFYMRVLDEWENTFKKIEKNSDPVNSINATGKTKELIENLACIGLSYLDQTNVYHMIKEWQGKGVISPKQAFDLREKLSILNSQNLESSPSKLMIELDQKVKQVKDFYR